MRPSTHEYLGRPEEEQHRIGGVALGYVGRPRLPSCVEVGEGVSDSDQLVPGQELGSPGRNTGPTLQQGDKAFASIERAVEGWQVGDLQGHDDHPYGAHGDVDARVGRAADVHRSHCEERGEGLQEAVTE
jgi:hypothetical protein